MLGSPNVNNFKTNPSSHEVHYSWCIFGISFSQFGSLLEAFFNFSQSCHLPLKYDLNRLTRLQSHYEQNVISLHIHNNYGTESDAQK